MFAGKSNAPVLEGAAGVRNPGLWALGMLGVALMLAHCTLTSDERVSGAATDSLGPTGGTFPGPILDAADGRIPAQGGDTARLPQPQAGQLTAGEIDDHLNFPQFKTYVQGALQAAGKSGLEFALPDEADVKDRFAGNVPRPKALDLAFAIDATGSMGDEMTYLAAEFQAIVGRIQSRHSPGS